MCKKKRSKKEVEDGCSDRLFDSCVEEHFNSCQGAIKCDGENKKSYVLTKRGLQEKGKEKNHAWARYAPK